MRTLELRERFRKPKQANSPSSIVSKKYYACIGKFIL